MISTAPIICATQLICGIGRSPTDLFNQTRHQAQLQRQESQLSFWLLASDKNQAQPTRKPTQTQLPSHPHLSRSSNPDTWYWCWLRKHLRLPIRVRERGWIIYLTIDSNPNLSSQSVFLSFFVRWVATNNKSLASNTFHYLEADVRRNGRKEVKEITLPKFQEEGLQLSQLGGYENTFRGNFVQPKLWP